jgi:hypothetical protein
MKPLDPAGYFHAVGEAARCLSPTAGALAAGPAEAREVEPQHGDPELGERPKKPRRRHHVLAAHEAMREQRIGPRVGLRQAQPGG